MILEWALNFALVLVPTVLMGLSLPLVARAVTARIDESGRLVGRLYGLNTLGAAVGSLLSGWFLMGRFGFVTSARIAGNSAWKLVSSRFLKAVAKALRSNKTPRR